MQSVRYTTTTLLGTTRDAHGSCLGSAEARSMEFPQEMSTSIDLGIRIMRPANDSTLSIEFPRPLYAGPVAVERA